MSDDRAPQGVVINPDAIYHDHQIERLLNIPGSVVKDAIASGKLRHIKLGRSDRLCYGRWIRWWLVEAATPPIEEATRTDSPDR
jgi:hypothetical protein